MGGIEYGRLVCWGCVVGVIFRCVGLVTLTELTLLIRNRLAIVLRRVVPSEYTDTSYYLILLMVKTSDVTRAS